jgi:hypothetical protein
MATLKELIIQKMERDDATIGKVTLLSTSGDTSGHEIWEIDYANGHLRLNKHVMNSPFPLDLILYRDRTIVVLETAGNVPGMYIFTMKPPDIIEEWNKVKVDITNGNK